MSLGGRDRVREILEHNIHGGKGTALAIAVITHTWNLDKGI